MNEIKKSVLYHAAMLGLFGIIGAALVGLTWQWTADRIAWNEQQTFLKKVYELIPRDKMDNDLSKDKIEIDDPELSAEPVGVYRARKNNQVIGIIFSPVQAAGYASPIKLMIGIYADGRLGGVRVLSHMETPGLGDKIDEKKSDWILGFSGHSLQNPPLKKWKVKKDGGFFDQFTGATITPRSVVAAIKKSLLYFEQHRDELLELKHAG